MEQQPTIVQQLPTEEGFGEIIIEMLKGKNIFLQRAIKHYFFLQETGSLSTDMETDVFEYVAWFITLYTTVRPHLEAWLIDHDVEDFKRFESLCDYFFFDEAEGMKDFAEKKLIGQFLTLKSLEIVFGKVLRELGYTKERKISQLTEGK